MDEDRKPLPAGGGRGKHSNRDKEGHHDDLDLNQELHPTHQQGVQQAEEEEEYDRYKNNPELLGETKSKATRMFSYDWASGYVSPFRPTPRDILTNMLQHVDFALSTLSTTPGHRNNNTILDLGCGDGLVLVQALETFSFSQLPRAIGVDLDRPLLEAARARIQQEHPPASSTSNDISEYDILSRLELYHGDLTEMHDPLTTIMAPPPPPPSSPHPNPTTTFSEPTTMDTLINQSSHLFVYLLPEALSKLAPLLLDALITKHKVVLSMRWEIPELSDYLVHGGERHQFYIYQSTAK